MSPRVGVSNVVINQAFVRNASGVISKIDIPDALDSYATGINNAGLISGYFRDTANNTHGFLFDGVHLTILNVPGLGPNGSATQTTALGINSAGTVVGFYAYGVGSSATPSIDGFLLKNGAYSDVIVPGVSPINVLPATGYSSINYAYGINSTGEIVGSYFARRTPPDEGLHAFIFDGQSYTTLDYPLAGVATAAYGVNDAGQIVGAFTDNNGVHAFLFSHNAFTQLDVLGSSQSQSFGINGTNSRRYY